MSMDFYDDVHSMHEKFEFHPVVDELDVDELRGLLEFRIGCLQEELDETVDALRDGNPEGIVDGLIDLIVFAIGTLDLYAVDVYKAWDRVHEANMAKQFGVKPNRPNPYGFPDLTKPDGWDAPSHEGNTGYFREIV